MEKVYMSEKELKTLSLYYEKKTNEATILNYTEEEIIKYFHLINENKVYTLEEIERQKEDLGLIKELQLFNKYIIVDSKIKGIIFHKGFATNFYDYKNENESFQDFITILKNIGHVLEKLEYMRKEENKLQTFFIGDLHEENILVNKETKKIQICDIDSCKIGNNQPFRTKYSFLKAYYYVFKHLNKKYPFNSNNIFIPNEDFDLYCYIVIILNTLFHINVLCHDVTDYFKQIYSLKEQGLPRPLFQIFLNIYSPAKNENPYRYLDAIPESFERKRKL